MLITFNPQVWADNNLTKRVNTCETLSVDLFPRHPTSLRHHRSRLAEKRNEHSNGKNVTVNDRFARFFWREKTTKVEETCGHDLGIPEKHSLWL